MPTLKREDQEQLEKAKDLVEENHGEMGYVKSLFYGRLKPEMVLPFPKQNEAEKARTDALIEQVRSFMKEHVDADDIDREERIPQEVLDGLGKLGVLGMTVPQQYGGGGFSHSAYCRVLEEIAMHCASTAVVVGAHQSIGLKALMLMGTEEQKKEFLPDLASGVKLAAFCLSEPEVGSDAANVQTHAELSPDGSCWILNGRKKYATNAALAGFMTVMAKTAITENGKTKDKVTAFIVTPDLPGFEVVKNNRSKMGIRGSWQATLKFTDMRVPKDRILGELGHGLKVALRVLNYGRCTLSAGCVGGAKVALRKAVEHARTRKQFGRTIGDFHLVKQKIARMAEMTYAMESLTQMCAGFVDRHADDIALETAICKLFCSEGLWQVADDALQIWGGEGYMRENGLERIVRDARINRIVEGATEVMTAFVALFGMKGVGEDLEHVMKDLKHPIGNFGRLAQFAKGQWDDVIVGHGFAGVAPEISFEARQLGKLTKTFARDILRVLASHREKVLDLQLIHQRIASVVIDLFAMTAVISRLDQMVSTDGATTVERDLIVGKGFCHHAVERIERNFATLFSNSDEEIIKVADAVLKDQ